MAKAKTVYQCRECGSISPRWVGQCPDCQAWNTLEESIQAPPSKSLRAGYAGAAGAALVSDLAHAEVQREVRISTALPELDRVLGGGLVTGSVVLIGGDPGIGKSTLLLQTLAHFAQAKRRVLYVSGEESVSQIKSRAERLGLPEQGIRVLTETALETVLATADLEKPEVLVADSIQTLHASELASAPGSVSQVRECAARLTQYAKSRGCAVFLVGHVTKEGGIAGPRVLEHIVDAVLYFEGESGSRFRLLRAFKNRFGAVNEIGVFAMSEKGLKEVSNPSAIFLSGAVEQRPGSLVMVTREGTRPLLVEVQALVDASPLSNPRRVAVGFDGNRLAMLLAVLHRHGGVAVYDQDVFVNIVGGIRATETAADLPVILAVLSSFRDRACDLRTVSFGEIGLAGEIRPVPNGEDRLKEAATHGFQRAIVPRSNLGKFQPGKNKALGDLELVPVQWLSEAIDVLLRR
jgi:DNA repair protein RadA/Sms